MKSIFVAALIFASINPVYSQSYPPSILTEAQSLLCDPSNTVKYESLSKKMYEQVTNQLETEASRSDLSLEDYLKHKLASEAYINYLRSKTTSAYMNQLSDSEFIVLSLDIGFRSKKISTYLNPEVKMEGEGVIKDQLLPRVLSIQNNPDLSKCASTDASDRGIVPDKSTPSSIPQKDSNGASQN